DSTPQSGRAVRAGAGRQDLFRRKCRAGGRDPGFRRGQQTFGGGVGSPDGADRAGERGRALTMTTAFLTAWHSAFLDVAAKSLLLFLVAGVAAGLLRRSSAALRHLVWQLLVFSLLALPLLSLALPVWRISLWQSLRSVA